MTYTVGPCAAAHHCRLYDRHTGQSGDADQHTLCHGCLDHAALAVAALPRDWYGLEQELPRPLGIWADGQPHGHTVPAPLNLHAEALQRAIWWTVTAWEEVARDIDRLAEPPPRRPGPLRRLWACTTGGTISRIEHDARLEHPTARIIPLRPGGADVARAVRILGPRLGKLSDVGPVEMVNPAVFDEDTTTVWRGRRHTAVPGWQGVLDLAGLHRRATATLGLSQPIRHLPGP